MAEQVLADDVIQRSPKGWRKSFIESDFYLDPRVSFGLEEGETADFNVSIRTKPVKIIKWQIKNDRESWEWGIEDHPMKEDLPDEMIEAYGKDDWWEKGPQEFMDSPLEFDKWRVIVEFSKRNKVYPNGISIEEEPKEVELEHEDLPSDPWHIEFQVGDFTNKKEMYETMRKLMKDMRTKEGLVDIYKTFGKDKPLLKTIGNSEYGLDYINEETIRKATEDIVYKYSDDLEYLKSEKHLEKIRERINTLKERVKSVEVQEEMINE